MPLLSRLNYRRTHNSLLYMKEITVYVIRNMNWQRSPETRCEYFLVRSNAASMRHTVSHNSSQSMFLTLSGTAMRLGTLFPLEPMPVS